MNNVFDGNLQKLKTLFTAEDDGPMVTETEERIINLTNSILCNSCR